MQSFIADVIHQVWDKYGSFNETIFILPSKRAGTFLKKEILKKTNKTLLSPQIFSIEEFVEKISKISYANSTQQIFELYKAYLNTGSFKKEPFDSFLKWGQTLLQDINEIDRYLIDTGLLFSNLSAIQEVNHWSLQSEKTELMENYLHFWKHLQSIYQNFNSALSKNGIGHQGLVYKKAYENLELYLKDETKNHIFLGFNALNKAESSIIQTILDTTNSEIYWDIDPYFLEDKIHDAGLFIRQHKSSWKSLQKGELKGLSTAYLSKKKIEIIGVPKHIAQTKYVGHILSDINNNFSDSLKKTAVILGDEGLLSTLLNAIPADITSVNITMGQKLDLTPLASFFLGFLEIHERKTKKGWFYKDFLEFLSHAYTSLLLSHEKIDTNHLISNIHERNWAYVTYERIEKTISNDYETANILFNNTKSDTPKKIIDSCQSLVELLKSVLLEKNDTMALEQLFKFYSLFHQIKMLLLKYEYLNSLKGLKNLFKQLLSSETLDFKGDPLEGLQIMGMLESRNLDFETVILTSVNEGVLPSGKSNNSFIPFDLKIAHGLPTYKEKDAVYTYHFYRILQRAKNIYLIYNTEPDVLEGGEKSRLITQLITDRNRKDITEKIAAPHILPIINTKEQIFKTKSLLQSIQEKAIKGFSPSSLSNYIRNPIDFYKQNLLGIREFNVVEETIASNTFGTIVHDSLEALYTPFVGVQLSKELLLEAKEKITSIVKLNFKKTYLDGDMNTGKNFLSYHVIEKYIQNFIEVEIKQLEKHTIKIVALEQNLSINLAIPNIGHPIILKGKLDRVDEIDGITRIIDYKTGKVEKRNVEIIAWEAIIDDYAFSKAFQLLCYALMYTRMYPTQELRAGIISFKNLKEGTMLFAKKETARGHKQICIDPTIISEFERSLIKLINEIHHPEIPFLEKEI